MGKNLFCIKKKWVYLALAFLLVLSVFLLAVKINKLTFSKNPQAGFFDCVITVDKSGNKVIKNPQKCCSGKTSKYLCLQNIGGPGGTGSYSVACQTGKLTKYGSYRECTTAVAKPSTGTVGKRQATGRQTVSPVVKKACPDDGIKYKCYLGNCEDYNQANYKFYEATEFSCSTNQGYTRKCCNIVQATPTPLPAASAVFEQDSGNSYKVIVTRGQSKNSLFINLSPIKDARYSGFGYCDLDTFPVIRHEEISGRGIEFGDMDVHLIPRYTGNVLSFDIRDGYSNKVILSETFFSTNIWSVYYNGGWQCVEK